MPKMKTHKGTQGNRMRLTRKGKIVRTQGNVRHLLTNRSSKRKRKLRQKAVTTTKGYVEKLRFAQQEGPARSAEPKPAEGSDDQQG